MSNTDTKHVLTAAMVAAYCNAQVVEIKTGAIGKVLEIHFKSDSLFVNEGDFGGYYSHASNFQLVLTSADKITDAQALQVAKEYYPTVTMYHNCFYGKSLVEDYKSDFDMQASCTRELSDICRSLNIDMGYKSIPSLIADGLAVEKEVSHE